MPTSHPNALQPVHIVHNSGNQSLPGSAESTNQLAIDEGIEKGFIGMCTYIMHHYYVVLISYNVMHVGLSR